MRRAFTLLEILTVVAISGILAVGTFKALKALYVRSQKARAVTELSLRTQTVLDQLSVLLESRLPVSVVGYDPGDGSFAPLGELVEPKPVLEWLGTAEEALTARCYSGFVDMNASDPTAGTLLSPDTNGTRLDAWQKEKFSVDEGTYAADRVRLAFAGSFDRGVLGAEAYGEAFGWHGGGSGRLYGVEISQEGTILLSGDPEFIYEKYYLVDTAYAVARAEDLNLSASCFEEAGIEPQGGELFLFFDYRPWKGETFCADPRGEGQSGRVTILAEEVSGFRAEEVDGTLRLSVDTLRPVRGSTPVRVAKQKVVF